jgi:hypothetical protein
MASASAPQPSSLVPADVTAPAPSATFELAKGHVVIKPRLQFELALSLHVLGKAEDHHQLLVPWAERMRRSLRPETLREAGLLMEHTHEWQLANLLRSYDGPDELEAIARYLEQDRDGIVSDWAARDGLAQLHRDLGIDAPRFARWYAGFLRRYWHEGFGREWLACHAQLVADDAAVIAKELAGESESPDAFLEKLTGRRFASTGRVILFPSSFSRPQHAYGFQDGDDKLSTYRIDSGRAEALGSALHELLHPLLRGWQNAPEVAPLVAKLAQSAAFRATGNEWARSYSYPDGWVEEQLVHALANFAMVRLKLADEREARARSYGVFEDALYDAMFRDYDHFATVDEFFLHFLRHVEERQVQGKVRYEYSPPRAVGPKPKPHNRERGF